MSKILIAYYSWGGNTRRIAQMLAEATGGDLFEILPQNPYSTDYTTCVAEAKAEISAGTQPALKSNQSVEEYDTVLVGTPNWWSTLAPPVATFLTGNSFAGKTVLPFCTHGGGGQARCFSDTAKACPGAKVADGLALYDDGGAAANATLLSWLAETGVL